MKKRMISMMVLIILFINVGMAEGEKKTAWEKSIQGGVNMTQTGYDNWAPGGENAFAWQTNLNYKFVRDMETMKWSNTGKFLYGATKTGSRAMRKASDEIKIESVLTYKLGSKVNPYLSATGETQFAAGKFYGPDTSYQISAFMDPGYFRESLGAGYQINESLATRFGLSFKQTITSDFPRPYADDPDTDEIEKIRSEVGLESVTDLSLKVSETGIWNSKLELFSAFSTIRNVDVNWDNTLTVKVTEYVNMNINFKLVYDKDVSEKRQIKQSMAIGLNYTFI